MISAAEATILANKTNRFNEQAIAVLTEEVLEIIDAEVRLACEGDEGLFECMVNLKQTTKSRKDIPDTLFKEVLKSVVIALKKLGYKVSYTTIKPGTIMTHNVKLAWGLKQSFDDAAKNDYKMI